MLARRSRVVFFFEIKVHPDFVIDWIQYRGLSEVSKISYKRSCQVLDPFSCVNLVLQVLRNAIIQ